MKWPAPNRRSSLLSLLLFLLISLTAEDSAALEYKTELAPVEDKILEDAAKASSLLIELEKKPPDSLYGLYRRAQDDRVRIEKALRSSGYYDGEVSILIAGRSVDQPAPNEGETETKTPIPVKIDIHPGPLYHLREINVTGAERLPTKLHTALAVGAPGRAADIKAEQDRLLSAVLAQGYPFATVKLEPALVDHKDQTMSIHYVADL